MSVNCRHWRILRVVALACALQALTACSVYPRIDMRPMEQQLADRPVPQLSPEDIALFASADRAKPLRISFGRMAWFGRSCAPLAPPVREMRREKVSRVEGFIEAVIQPSGLIGKVVATRVVPDGIKEDVEALFAQALTTAPCRFPPMQTELLIEIPFVMVVN